jgi:hypothetical protein
MRSVRAPRARSHTHTHTHTHTCATIVSAANIVPVVVFPSYPSVAAARSSGSAIIRATSSTISPKILAGLPASVMNLCLDNVAASARLLGSLTRHCSRNSLNVDVHCAHNDDNVRTHGGERKRVCEQASKCECE